MLVTFLIPILVVAVAAAGLWFFRQRMTIKLKLIALSVSIGLGSIYIIGAVATHQAGTALLAEREHGLEGLLAARKTQVESLFGLIHEQINGFTRDQSIIEATHRFSSFFSGVWVRACMIHVCTEHNTLQ